MPELSVSVPPGKSPFAQWHGSSSGKPSKIDATHATLVYIGAFALVDEDDAANAKVELHAHVATATERLQEIATLRGMLAEPNTKAKFGFE